MKKILLIVGIAFGCSSVYAQNTIEQSGNNNSFTADQTQKTNPATVYHVTQYQGYNWMKVTQGADVFTAGQENIANLRQISIGVTALNLRNYMDVSQSGASNRINSDQYGQNNRLKATQTVFTNTSTISTSQSGWNNGIVVLQDGDPAGGTAQFSTTIQQGAAIPAGTFTPPNGVVGPLPNTSRNTVMLSQIGVGRGTANITQLGSSGLATVTQRGGDITQNLMTIYQTNNGGANVQQAGNNNNIVVAQQGYQYAKVRQESADPANQTEPVNSIIDIRQGVNQLDDTRNSADVSQRTGDGNQTYVRQNTNGAERNYATVRQIGTRLGGTPSQVTIDQLGKSSTVEVEQMENSSGNRAFFTQSNSELFKGSNAKLNQGGSNNTYTSNQIGMKNNIGGTIGDMASFGKQMGVNNTTGIGQNGQNNQIALSQDGSSNTISVSQFNDMASTEGNKATVTQGAGTSQNVIVIDQTVPDGDNNVAIVNQTKGDLNRTDIIQYEDNYAMVTQSGTDDLGNTSTVNINQSAATGAKATVTQADKTKGGDVIVVQSALNNEATVNQNAGPNGSRQNLAIVQQTDDGNKATVTQSGTIDGIIGQAIVVQAGKDGQATITQSANGSWARADQYGGDRNITMITQNGMRRDSARTEQGGDDNNATVMQGGDNNVARILQGGVMGTLDHAMNTAKITQAGTENDAVTAQGGQLNNAEIMQTTGRNNFAATVQYGTNNMAMTTQSSPGKNNTVTIQQLRTNNPGLGGGSSFTSRNANTVAEAIKTAGGNYNGTDIAQVENNKATVNQLAGENQVAGVLQTGDDETLTLTQRNTDNAAAILQAGEFDKATINQNGSFGIAITGQYGTDGQAGNSIEAAQAGSYNAFVVGQGYHNNTALIDQKGSENGLNGSGVLTGGIIVGQYGQRNVANITQDANMSFIGVAQGNIAPALPSITLIDLLGFTQVFDNTSTVTQKGRQNIALIGQQGDKGTATITQDGQNNAVLIAQLNVGLTTVFSLPNKAEASQSSTVSNSQISILQRGRGNDALVKQLDGRFQQINLQQDLDENKATLTQVSGRNNVINLNQGTDPGRVGHTATMTQTGEDNLAQMTQSGYKNKVTLTQNGDRNILRQDAGNAFALQGGHDNEAMLSQTGHDHIINFNQSGMNNMATITQADF